MLCNFEMRFTRFTFIDKSVSLNITHWTGCSRATHSNPADRIVRILLIAMQLKDEECCRCEGWITVKVMCQEVHQIFMVRGVLYRSTFQSYPPGYTFAQHNFCKPKTQPLTTTKIHYNTTQTIRDVSYFLFVTWIF